MARAEKRFQADLQKLQERSDKISNRQSWQQRGQINTQNRKPGPKRHLVESTNENEEDENELNNTTARRSLRFREGIQKVDGLDFRPDLLSRSLIKRIGDFQQVYSNAKGERLSKLDTIHSKLLEFGYGLKPTTYNSFLTKTNKLSKWEIV